MKSIVLFAAVLRIILITAIISLAVFANAQNVALNTTGTQADASAMLDISSTSKGFLPPRMTTTQRTGIALPANGLIVFDTDTKTYWYFSTSWKEINNTAGGSFSLPYSGISASATSVFSITNPNLTIASSAIYGRNGSGGSGFIPLYSMGVWGDNSTGVGVAGSSNSIGVLGITNGNDGSGIGVKGVNSSDFNAAVTGENSSSGGGVRGIFTGPVNSIGYGVIGETGRNGNIGVAGKFISNNPNDPTNTLWALNYGKGAGLTVTMSNNQNSEAAIDINHTGTGKLLKLYGQNNAEFSVNNNGNTMTSGTITVKSNKGIVRNSTSAQMRVESINAPITAVGGIDLPNGTFGQLTVTFSTAFSSPPVVYVGNILNHSNSATFIVASVTNVTTTGCKLNLRNASGGTLNGVTGAWQLIAMGAE